MKHITIATAFAAALFAASAVSAQPTKGGIYSAPPRPPVTDARKQADSSKEMKDDCCPCCCDEDKGKKPSAPNG